MRNKEQNQGIYYLLATNNIEVARSDHMWVSNCDEYGVRIGGIVKRCRRFFHSTNCERIYALISETEKLR